MDLGRTPLLRIELLVRAAGGDCASGSVARGPNSSNPPTCCSRALALTSAGLGCHQSRIRGSVALPLTATIPGGIPTRCLPRGTKSYASAAVCDPALRCAVPPVGAYSPMAWRVRGGQGLRVRVGLSGLPLFNGGGYVGKPPGTSERVRNIRWSHAIHGRARHSPPLQAPPAHTEACPSKARSVGSDAGQSRGGHRYAFRRLLPERA